MKKSEYTKENIKLLEIKLADWIYDLSICFSETASPLPMESIAKMTEMIVRQIKSIGMTIDPEPYRRAIKLIASGQIDTYKLNVVNLMKAFRIECAKYAQEKITEIC